MRLAIYTRVSTDEQASSAAAQEAGARAWAEREGHAVVAVYRDEGVSGGEWVHRPGVLQLRADAASTPRPWDVLVVRDLDRLGRDAIRLPELLSHLGDHDVRVVEWSTGQTVALDGMALIVAQLRAGLAQIEREQIAHRTRTALAQKAARGLVTGGRVYGYQNRRTSDGVVYELDPAEAATVRDLYARVIRGESLRAIARALNASGVPSPRAEGGGTGSWCPETVRGIVRSPRYRGEATWGELGARYRGGTRVTVVRDDAIRYAVPPIVDEETWQRAQAQSERARTAAGLARRPGREPRYLLVGHAVCADCGGPLASARTSTGSGATRRVVPAYTCGHARERGTCSSRWHRPTARVDAAVLDWLASEVLDPATIRAACARARELHRAAAERPDPRVESLRAEETELSRAVTRLTAALEHGADDVAEVVQRLRDRRTRLEAVRAELSALAAPVAVVSLDAERRIVDAAARVREALSASLEEHPAHARDVLGAVLVGRIQVGLREDGRLWLAGVSAPSRLLWSEPGGTRGLAATPTGTGQSPGSAGVPLARAV